MTLVFTPEVKLKETGNNLEITGIRNAMKYPPDYSGGDQADNRLCCIPLCRRAAHKAEGVAENKQCRGRIDHRELDPCKTERAILATLDANALIDERGRELYFEGWRRQDLIRFGKFLTPGRKNQPMT